MPRSCLHIFNGNRSSDVTKGDALGVIAPSSRKKLPSLKKYKKNSCFFAIFQLFPCFWGMLLCVYFIKNVYKVVMGVAVAL